MSGVAEETKYDSVYLGIVQSQKGIDNIIGTFFGFLRRKTDFFSQEERAKEIVLNHTRTQCAIFQRELELEAAARAARAAAPAPAPKPAVSAPRAAPAAAAPPAPTRPRIEEVRDEPEPSAAAAAGGPTDADKDAATEIPSVDASAEGDPKKKPNHGNGGDTDKYIWQQTLEDVSAPGCVVVCRAVMTVLHPRRSLFSFLFHLALAHAT